MDSTDEQLAKLQAEYPGWQIWVVGIWGGGQRWCARNGSTHKEADTAAHLAEYIGEWPDS